jgi:hypothetical protein
MVRWGQSVSQSVCLGIDHPCGTCDHILLPVRILLSEICGLVSVGRPLVREDGSAICNVITQWSKSRRTRNHTVLSSDTPPTWRARFPYLYPPGTGWPSYTPGHWVPFKSSLTTHNSQGYGGGILTLTLCISFKNMMVQSKVKVMLRPMASQSVCHGMSCHSHFTADSQSVYLGVESTLWMFDQILLPFQEFGSGICCPVCGAPSLTRDRVCLL